jgi:hypothetical protein
MKLCTCAIALGLASTAGAQLTAGADLAWRTRGTWRGLDRVTHTVLQPAAYVALGQGVLQLATGAWANIEPLAARADEYTYVGRRRRGVGEVDVWAQGTLRRDRYTSFTAGIIAYTFHGDASTNGLSNANNTTELYLRGELRALLGLEHELTYWRDVDRVRGGFAEYTVRRSLPLFPEVLPPTLVLAGTVGFSHDEAANASESGYFARDGYRYTDVSVGTMPVLALGRLDVAVGGTLHYLAARNDQVAAGGSSPLPRAWWAELTISLPAPRLEAR